MKKPARRRTRSARKGKRGVEGHLRFDADGSLDQVGPVPLSRYVAALTEQLRMFLARLESCERADTGDFLLRDSRVGLLDGVRVIWENVGLLCGAILASTLVPLAKEDRAEFERTGILARVVGPTRNMTPLADAVRQLMFAIVRPPDGTWPERIRASTERMIRTISIELPVHRRLLERTEGGPAPTPPDLEQRELIDALRRATTNGLSLTATDGSRAHSRTLTPNEERVMGVLDGKRLSAEVIASTINTSLQEVRECVVSIRTKRGKDAIHTCAGGGYMRPDRPPATGTFPPRRRRVVSPVRRTQS